MTDPNVSPTELPGFPERPAGSDRMEIRIVADRPDPQTDQTAADIGLALLAAGLPEDILDAFVSVGCPRDQIYVQATFLDTEQAPVVRLGDVFPEAVEPTEADAGVPAPSDTPDPETDPAPVDEPTDPEVAAEG